MRYWSSVKKKDLINTARKEFNAYFKTKLKVKQGSERPFQGSIFVFSGLGVAGISALNLHRRKVLCEGNRTAGTIKFEEKDTAFPWSRFLQYLYPHVWYFLLALVVSLKFEKKRIYYI